MHHLALVFAALVCLVPCVRTQSVPGNQEAKPNVTKKHFLPQNYPMELRVNIGELTAIGLIDELRKSPMWTFFSATLKPMAFDVEDIEFLTVAHDDKRPELVYSVMEGAKVALPNPDLELGAGFMSYVAAKHAKFREHPVVLERRQWMAEDEQVATHRYWASPAPGVVVYGPRAWVESGLARKNKRGVPSMQVMELRGHQSLASQVTMVHSRTIEFFGSALETTAWISEANPFELLAVRFSEPAPDEFTLEAVCRFRKAGAEPDAFAKALREKHAKMAKQPSWKALKSVQSVVVEVSGLDVTLKLSVGDADEVARLLQNIVGLQAVPMVLSVAFGVQPVGMVQEDRAGDAPAEPATEAKPAAKGKQPVEDGGER